MASPVEFISLDPATAKFTINDKAIAILNKIKGPVAVVSVCGRARQGKSFLLNQIVRKLKKDQGTTAGFAVSKYHKPCTKGLWIWSEPIVLPGTAPDGRKVHVVLIDCEGIDAYDQTHRYSTQIFSLAVLLSSLFVFNQLGGIDETSLERLSLVSELSRVIYSKASSDGASVDARDFAPAFLWLLRDFHLEISDDGREMTPKDYLEETLLLLGGGSEEVKGRNQVRESIRSLFPNRDCFALVRPVVEESQLRNLDTVPLNQMREVFREGLNQLVNNIIQRAQPKHCFGVVANGPALAGLTQAFVGAINEGAVPAISTAWQNVVRSECQRAVDAAKQHYFSTFSTAVPADEAAFAAEHTRALDAATELFCKEASMASSMEQEPYLKQLRAAGVEHMQRVKTQRFAEASANVSNLISTATAKFSAILNDINPQDPAQRAALNTYLKEFVAQYEATATGPTKYPRLLDFLDNIILAGMHRMTANMATRAEKAEHEVKAKTEALAQVEKKTQELHMQLSLSSQKNESNEREIAHLKQDQHRLQSELSQLRQEKGELQGQLAKASADSMAFMQQVTASQSAYDELRKEVQNMQQELMAAQVNISSITADRDQLATQLAQATADMKASASTLSQSLSKKEAELAVAQAEQQHMRAELTRQEKDAAEVQATLKRVRQELDETRAQYKQSLSSANKTQGDLSSLQQQLLGMTQKEREARLQAEEVKQQYEAVAEKEREARQQAIALQGQVRTAEEQKTALSHELKTTQAQLESLATQMHSQVGDHAKAYADLQQQLETTQQKLQDNLHTQEQLQGLLANTQETLETALMEKATLLAEVKFHSEKLQASSQERTTLEETVQAVRNELQAAKQTLDTLVEEKKRLDEEKKKLEQELSTKAAVAEQLAAELATAKSEGADLVQANANVASLKQQLDDAEGRVRAIQAEKTRMQASLVSLEESVARMTAERDEAIARQRELRSQMAVLKHVDRMAHTASPSPSATPSGAGVHTGRVSIDAAGIAAMGGVTGGKAKATTQATPLQNPVFNIGSSPRPAGTQSTKATPVRKAAPVPRNVGYSSPVINMFADFEQRHERNNVSGNGTTDASGAGFVFTAGTAAADNTTTPIKEEDGAENTANTATTPVPIPNMSPVEELVSAHVTPKGKDAFFSEQVPVGATAMEGVAGEEDESPSAPPVPEPAEPASVRGGREKRKREEEDIAQLSPDLQREAKRAGGGRATPPVMSGAEGASQGPSSPYGTPVNNPESMTITAIKEWLSLNGFESDVWKLSSMKPKKAEWVKLIKEKSRVA